MTTTFKVHLRNNHSTQRVLVWKQCSISYRHEIAWSTILINFLARMSGCNVYVNMELQSLVPPCCLQGLQAEKTEPCMWMLKNIPSPIGQGCRRKGAVIDSESISQCHQLCACGLEKITGLCSHALPDWDPEYHLTSPTLLKF